MRYCSGGIADNANWQQSKKQMRIQVAPPLEATFDSNFNHGIPAIWKF